MKKPKILGVMMDMSRNAVMTIDALKKYFVSLRKMGYNFVMLYTEDIYEVDGEPFFGYMRGRYSKEELKELDAFAAELGIELVPCIQTLAHLDAFVRWGKVPTDADVTLMVDEPRVYEFIENCVKACRECFRSKYLHIGMDEAFGLGRGKHIDKYGYEPRIDMFRRHLGRVNEIVKKYDFSTLMWIDMFFACVSNGQFTQPKREMPKLAKEALPKDIIPIYADYYWSGDKGWAYDAMLYNSKQLSEEVWFAGGVWTWGGFLPNNSFSFDTMTPALQACRDHKIENILFCLWGDDGAECSRYGVLPALYRFSQMVKGNDDEEKIRRGFRRIFGAEYDAFMSLDKLNYLIDNWKFEDNLPKEALYNDYFHGIYNVRLQEGKTDYIGEVAAEWHGYAKKYRKYAPLFESAACLADVLAIKYDLGIRTRAAYKAGDKDALRKLANEDYATVKKRIERFAAAFEKQWMAENKPFGFEIQHARLGGLVMRTDACRRRILDYVNGKLEKIDELEVELLPDAASRTFSYKRLISPCRI